jgi:hypothetical protein
MGRSVAWKQFERVIAATWGSFRVPLSGINSRHNAGDVIIPDDLSLLIECKTRAGSLHWTMFDEACQDAKRNGVNPLHTLLYFKQKHKQGYIVTLDGELFEKMLAIPEVRKLFAKEVVEVVL